MSKRNAAEKPAEEAGHQAGIEKLFAVERDLRSAAVQYAADRSEMNRKVLREAAIVYADLVIEIEDVWA